jgi:hypothetical protein
MRTTADIVACITVEPLPSVETSSLCNFDSTQLLLSSRPQLPICREPGSSLPLTSLLSIFLFWQSIGCPIQGPEPRIARRCSLELYTTPQFPTVARAPTKLIQDLYVIAIYACFRSLYNNSTTSCGACPTDSSLLAPSQSLTLKGQQLFQARQIATQQAEMLGQLELVSRVTMIHTNVCRTEFR